MQAYVLVQTDTRRRQIAEEPPSHLGVVYAEDVSGPYDTIAFARQDQVRTTSRGCSSRSSSCLG